MRVIIATSLMLLSLTVSAGGYYNLSIDTYDPETGFYYKGVESKRKSGFLGGDSKLMTNLYVYNPAAEEGKLVFPEGENFQVVALFFEESVEDGVVRFYSSYSALVKNNNSIVNRKPKPTMLILTRNSETELRTFYVSGKDGSNLTEVKSIDPAVNWHIDVKHSKVRIVNQVGKSIKIESFSW